VLPLSDHADYDELVHLARATGAERIITMHGEPKFAAALRELGLNAEHLAHHPGSAKSETAKRRKAKKDAAVVEPSLFD
jgi:Cft2 family RNA processing exonuclease